jgi:hypothetical protein
MKKIFILFTVLFVISLFSFSCVSVKSTFEEQSRAKIKIKPSQDGMMNIANDRIYFSGNSNSPLDKGNKVITGINTQPLRVQWTEAASRIAKIPKTSEDVIFLNDLEIAIVFSRTKGSLLNSSYFYISAIDLKDEKPLWTNQYKSSEATTSGGLYLSKNQSFLIQTTSGLECLDVLKGNTLWTINDLNVRVNLGSFSFGLGNNTNNDFMFISTLDRILLNKNQTLALLNPYTGEYEWKISDEVGRSDLADFFYEEGYAVYYGRDVQDRNSALTEGANSLGNGSFNNVLTTVNKGLNRGVLRTPIILIDLKTGQIKWKNKFYTQGNHQVAIAGNSLLINGVVAYCFDINTGEITWQSVDDKRLDKEGILGVFSEFSGIAYEQVMQRATYKAYSQSKISDKVSSSNSDRNVKVSVEKPVGTGVSAISDFTSNKAKVHNAVIVDNTIFTVFPELFDRIVDKNKVSIRLNDFLTGELIWKTEPHKWEVKDLFLQSGILFVVVNGKYGLGSKWVAIDPYSGKIMYEIDSKEPINNPVVTDTRIYHFSALKGILNIYDIRTGMLVDFSKQRNFVIDIRDMGDQLMIVWGLSKSKMTGSDIDIAFHDRENFKLLSKVSVPFYSRDFISLGNKLFMIASRGFKGIVHLDLNSMKMLNYAIVQPSRTFTTNGKSQSLDSYGFMLSGDANNLYFISRKNLVKYRISN